MLGTIGYSYGFNRVLNEYGNEPRQYGPHALLTTCPARSVFPRGFLWDEGFHHLLFRRFDPELSLKVNSVSSIKEVFFVVHNCLLAHICLFYDYRPLFFHSPIFSSDFWETCMLFKKSTTMFIRFYLASSLVIDVTHFLVRFHWKLSRFTFVSDTSFLVEYDEHWWLDSSRNDFG